MDCPGCNVEMSDYEEDGTALRKCGECGSLWIDVADLNRVLLHHNLYGLESLGGRPEPEAMTGQCPDCQVDLVRVAGGDRQHPVFYDTCESCGGILLELDPDDSGDPKVLIQQIVSFFQRFSAKKKSVSA